MALRSSEIFMLKAVSNGKTPQKSAQVEIHRSRGISLHSISYFTQSDADRKCFDVVVFLQKKFVSGPGATGDTWENPRCKRKVWYKQDFFAG